MQCDRCIDSLHAYVDGELLPDEMDAVRRHLEGCAACTRAYETIRDSSRLLRSTLMRYPAPDVLKARIRVSAAAETQRAGAPPRSRSAVDRMVRSRVAAVALIAAVVGSGATAAVMRRGAAQSPVAEQVLASHIRSLMPGHLTDVASNDQHNVKPWFNGRVNLSPPVPRLDSVGYPLVGGRLDYVDGHPVAVVVYQRRQHVINVFWWAPQDGAAASSAPAMSSDNGYNIIRGRRDGLEQWIVSDLNTAELQDFARRLGGG
jgi:anti-sigma factor (TIGR02949 family)